jgi:hypothetical protein
MGKLVKEEFLGLHRREDLERISTRHGDTRGGKSRKRGRGRANSAHPRMRRWIEV